MLPISASSECQTTSPLILSRPRNSSHLVVDRWTALDGTSPSLHAHYRRFVTTTRRSALLARARYSAARGLATCRPPGESPCQSTGTRVVPRSSPVPLQSPNQARAIFKPGTARAVDRFPSDLSQDSIKALVLMPPGLTTRRRWFTLVRLLGSHLPPLTTAFPRTFTTMAHSPQQLVAVLTPAPAYRCRRTYLHLHNSMIPERIPSSTSEPSSSLQDTPTPWPRRSTRCTRPNSSATADRGEASTTSRSPPSSTSTGTTTGACTASSGTCRPPSTKHYTG